jgi:hypothetical protein
MVRARRFVFFIVFLSALGAAEDEIQQGGTGLRPIRLTRDGVVGTCRSVEESREGISLTVGGGRAEIPLATFGTRLQAVNFTVKLLKVPDSLRICFEQQFKGEARNGIWLDAVSDGKASLQAGMEPYDRLTLAHTKRPKTPLSGKEVRNLYPGTEAIELGFERSVPCVFSVDFGSGTGSIHYVARIGERVFEYWGRNVQRLGSAEYLSASIVLTTSSPTSAA